MNTLRYKMIIAYDGTDYQGWQTQPHGAAIVDIMQAAFRRAFKKDIVISGASRTDSGVHALGQVAAFSSDINLSPERILKIWNDALPKSIHIFTLQPVGLLFNPRAHVLQKTYQYHFFSERPHPLVSRYGYYAVDDIDFELLKKALHVFVGTHDFRSFCTGNEMASTIRTIDSITVQYNNEWQAHQIVIKGKSFLRYMIRRIVGASLQVASGQKPFELLEKSLLLCDPGVGLFNAPAHGLLLYTIEYGDNCETKI